MARWMLLLTAMFLILACVMGCSDDDEDCPTCPEATVQPLGWTQGTVYLDPGSLHGLSVHLRNGRRNPES